MPVKYKAEITSALSEELRDCLSDNEVVEGIAKFLVENGITKLGAFADLADTKTGIVQVVGRPAGLDPDDSIACQPLKSAWRRAEAETKAALDAKAKGEDPDKQTALGSEQRLRLDEQAKDYYRFVWPAQWLSGNLLLGRLKKMLDKRTDFVPRMELDVKNIHEKEVDPLFKVLISNRGGLHAQAENGYSPVQGLTKFRERHFQLMIAYNQAACPEFHKVCLTVLFEYHQWLMEKIQDGKWTYEIVVDYLKADFEMRTKWMLSWQRKEFGTFAEVITHHRGQSAYLFADIRGGGASKRSRSKDRRVKVKAERDDSPSDDGGRRRKKEKGLPPTAKREWPGLERTNADGYRRCPFYNKGTGCRKGKDCPDAHECDFPSCGRKHCRADHHPIKPM